MLSRTLFLFAIAITCLLLAAVATSAQGQQGTQPLPWPPVHTHEEVMWSEIDSGSTPQDGQTKKFDYNFPAGQMKVTGKYAFGSALSKGQGITSYWLNNTLFMYIQADIFGKISDTCQPLNLGFGMPTPNWFLPSPGDNITNYGSLFATRRGNTFDNNYYNVTWWSKGSPDGPFNYLFYSNNKYENGQQGMPFSMWAPSPMGIVANEYYNFKSVDSFPQGTFTLPPQCNNKKMHNDEESFFAELERDLSKMVPGQAIEKFSKMTKTHLFELKLMAAGRQQQQGKY